MLSGSRQLRMLAELTTGTQRVLVGMAPLDGARAVRNAGGLVAVLGQLPKPQPGLPIAALLLLVSPVPALHLDG